MLQCAFCMHARRVLRARYLSWPPLSPSRQRTSAIQASSTWQAGKRTRSWAGHARNKWRGLTAKGLHDVLLQYLLPVILDSITSAQLSDLEWESSRELSDLATSFAAAQAAYEQWHGKQWGVGPLVKPGPMTGP